MIVFFCFSFTFPARYKYDFGFTASLLVMLLPWKSGSYTINLNDSELAAVIVCTGIDRAGAIAIFLMPR